MMGRSDDLLARLQEAGRCDLSDFLTFEVRPDDEHPEIQNDGMRYDGFRFRVACRLAGKLYGEPFGVDVVCGEPILGQPDTARARDVLDFAGIDPPVLRLVPIETHIAEKLHAYTVPRRRPNSRIKDLPDLALLATAGDLDARRVRMALEQTFAFRKTHELPTSTPAPAPSWAAPYAAMAREDRLRWTTLEEVTSAVRAFLDPALAGGLDATWNRVALAWQTPGIVASGD